MRRPALATTRSSSRTQKTPGFASRPLPPDSRVPWGFAWLPNKDLIFTERPGRVRIIQNGKLRAEPVFVVPDVEPSGESGLMDISLHPDFAKNSFVYLAYSYNKEGNA